MTKTTLLLASIAVLTQSFPSFAGVYKCEMPGGRLAYQSQPCPITATKAIVTELEQRVEIAEPVEPLKDELIEPGDSTLPEEKPKTWLEKRAEERVVKDAARKERYEATVKEARDELKFAELIRKKQIAIDMKESHVLASWGSPSSTNQTITANGVREQWVYKRFYRGYYTGTEYVYFQNGKVVAIQKD
ncbi:hypothetical protein [Neptunomonas phycophila]|uniref:hypothetical protein n=1 Tax=Neptunomonas TaxID=75687 RepID=UPI0026E14FF2|nr:hypothetical protein [Neptunomonas phycophila]MDO6466781.1 hypothetical protein [Neptunomonas phycophila]